jgi:NADH-quinone oxidoreductase subunit M
VKDDVRAMPDLNAREWSIMVPLAAVTLWMGVYPESFLAPMRQDVQTLVARVADSRAPSDAALTAGKPAAKSEHGNEHHTGGGQ